jgi:hypothetical protein
MKPGHILGLLLSCVSMVKYLEMILASPCVTKSPAKSTRDCCALVIRISDFEIQQIKSAESNVFINVPSNNIMF